jgi:hypothetical protein
MKPITLALLLLALLVAGCVDADDGGPTIAINEQAGSRPAYLVGDAYAPDKVHTLAAEPDRSRTVSYLSEEPWDGWEASPQRVKVTVRTDDRRPHTHYFESLPAAYGWLPERYGEFDIVEMMVANALTGRDLLDFDNAYFLMTRDYGQSLPVVLAYPSRHQASVYRDGYPERYTLVERVELDRSLDDWRARHWGNWRDDFGFMRTPTVAHYDGRFWDGWYETPDRVLVRMSDDGDLSSYYFDSLPVAWSWIDRRPSSFELVDLQVGAADGSLRLLPARGASYVFHPADDNTLPAMLAFATTGAAQSYLRALGSDDFRVVSWDGLKPHLKTWSDHRWEDWRESPRRERGIARALESGLGHKLGLQDRASGVVAGDRRVRERLSNNERGNGKRAAKAEKRAAKAERKAAKAGKANKSATAKASGRDKSKASRRGGDRKAGKAKQGDKSRGRSKAKGDDRRGRGNGKSKARGGHGKRGSDDHGRARGDDRGRGKSGKDGRGKGRDSGGGKGKGKK